MVLLITSVGFQRLFMCLGLMCQRWWKTGIEGIYSEERTLCLTFIVLFSLSIKITLGWGCPWMCIRHIQGHPHYRHSILYTIVKTDTACYPVWWPAFLYVLKNPPRSIPQPCVIPDRFCKDVTGRSLAASRRGDLLKIMVQRVMWLTSLWWQLVRGYIWTHSTRWHHCHGERCERMWVKTYQRKWDLIFKCISPVQKRQWLERERKRERFYILRFQGF